MRKLCAVLAAFLVFAGATAASAIEVKVKGNWGYSVGILKNSYKYNMQSPKTTYIARGRTQDSFFTTSRMRTQVDFIASKDVWGKLYFEVGKMDWGRPGDSGAPLDADMVNIKIKSASSLTGACPKRTSVSVWASRASPCLRPLAKARSSTTTWPAFP